MTLRRPLSSLFRRTISLAALLCLGTATLLGQNEKFSYKFYGFVRGDLYYNSRLNDESFEGVFYLFPKDIELDEAGNDKNAIGNTNFNMMTSRVGLDLTGPSVLGASTCAKLETDFAGFAGSHTMLRIRHAFMRLNWEKPRLELTLGQTWHPMFGDFMPRTLNVSTGAPFQPFSRTPQMTLRYAPSNFSFVGSLLFQYQFMSTGPDGKNSKYIRHAKHPELFAGINYKRDNLILSTGIDVVNIRPRTLSTNDQGAEFVANEYLTTYGVMLSGQYSRNLLTVAAKTTYGQSMTHLSMMGGYGVSEHNPENGAYGYSPLNHSTSWLNITYGKKYQIGTFLGYSKNLGSNNPLIEIKNQQIIYGVGSSIDQLIGAQVQFSYNLPHWTIGVEYYLSRAYYGKADTYGRIKNTHGVNNHRSLLLLTYFF